VVYLDHDAVVVAHARALLDDDAGSAVVHADIRDPAGLLEQVRAADLIDWTGPCGVFATAVMHFVAESSGPQQIVAELTGTLAEDSYLALTHITADRLAQEKAEAFTRIYDGASEKLHFRTKEQFESLFTAAGLDIVEPYSGAGPQARFLAQWSPPDLPPAPDPAWREQQPSRHDSAASRLGYAAVARCQGAG
jgi:hypothetical protein